MKALTELVRVVQRRPISQPEFRQRTGYSKTYVNDVFCAAELLGLIQPVDDYWKDRTRPLTGRGARRYTRTGDVV
jgi:hypothetical protein